MRRCLVTPRLGSYISGILSNNKRITEPTELNLNDREILKCQKFGTVKFLDDEKNDEIEIDKIADTSQHVNNIVNTIESDQQVVDNEVVEDLTQEEAIIEDIEKDAASEDVVEDQEQVSSSQPIIDNENGGTAKTGTQEQKKDNNQYQKQYSSNNKKNYKKK